MAKVSEPDALWDLSSGAVSLKPSIPMVDFRTSGYGLGPEKAN